MEFILEPEMQKSDSVWDNYVPIVCRGNSYTVYLTDSIQVPAEYNQLIHLLDSLESYHNVDMIINNGGGAVDSAFMIRDAMMRCPAKITSHLSGTVASAATIISLASDELKVSPFLSFMVHNYSHSSGHDSGNKVRNYVNFTDRELKRAFRDIYTNFLTESEISDVTTRDKEIWLNEIDVMQRWDCFKKNEAVPEELAVNYEWR